MTEVTSCNFERLAPEIEAAIENAAFVAIDTEFTGLVQGPDAMPSLFDSIEERYAKLRQTVASFYVCQLGLCTFTSVPEENLYRANAFNIYLCPRSFGNVDPQFCVQASSVEFLCQNGFDFNKCFYKGVPYADRACQRAADLYIMNERYFEKPGLAQIYDSVRHWLNNNDRTKSDGDDSLTVMPPEGLSVALVMADLKTRFPGVDVRICRGGLKLTLSEGCEPQRVAAEGRAPTETELRCAMLGFSRCFEVLAASGKPVVGHNMLLDLLLLYHQFCEPLPKSYARLKAGLSSVFPAVYDTKHMSLQLRQQGVPWLKELMSGADLFSLHKALSNAVVPYAPRIEGAPKDLRAHEAGCDAYAAGFVFLKLAHIVAQRFPTPPRALSWKNHRDAVRPYANRVNLIRAQYHHLSLGTADRTAETRPPWLCIRSSDQAQAKVRAVLARCGVVDMRRLSNSCLLVAVGNFGCARDIVEAFQDDPAVRVVKYNSYRHGGIMRAWLWMATVGTLALTAGCALQLASGKVPAL
ncbi:pre-piRNA 3'-exonuclease trimmer-like [Dermacentor variabilis]|uniref:pre-piRNA 3'-exonuclease trimmer-like n=1 Tax=Dermacentor variabilis TaxID=34621 RepID=UPI003F5B8563